MIFKADPRVSPSPYLALDAHPDGVEIELPADTPAETLAHWRTAASERELCYGVPYVVRLATGDE